VRDTTVGIGHYALVTDRGTTRDAVWASGPTVTTASAPNGAHFRIEIVPPGEPTRRRALFAWFALLMQLVAHGGSGPTTANPDWVVMIMRQRGAFRGFDVVAERRFDTYSTAAHYMDAVRVGLTERGQIPSAS
jgi:hypothetical protein